jgi:UDP-N-acetylmuramoyl-L-alanyl-D-glutamate--2,6-diaminopimelate ligase
VDRREAIARALQLAKKGDLVLVAGRGHETYQEVEGRKIRFDDREVVKSLVEVM